MRPRKAFGFPKNKLPEREQDELFDEFPFDEHPENEVGFLAEEASALDWAGLDRVCLDCGEKGRGNEGCAHREVARLTEASRSVGEAVARLRRAAAEHRAASRALRALVMAEVGRDRAEIEMKPEPAANGACARCEEQERDAAPETVESAETERCGEEEPEEAKSKPRRKKRAKEEGALRPAPVKKPNSQMSLFE